MKSVSAHTFSEVPAVDMQRSKFKRSFGVKTTFDAGYIIPLWCEEVLPGDTIALNGELFARLATPTYPVLDNMHLDTFYFFVANRLVWDKWRIFCGEQVDPGDSIDYTVPIIASDATGYDNESIFDYFGLPTKVTASYDHSALPFRMYNMIWRDWFRDQNLQDSPYFSKSDGPDLYSEYTLLRRCKRHDYFTACLPFLQKGDAVQLSLGTTAPVQSTGDGIAKWTDGSTVNNLAMLNTNTTAQWGSTPTASASAVWSDPKLETDLSAATASTVNELRQAIQIQRLLERDARAGTRYTEIIQSHFGVISPDSRMQRPELLGMSSTPVRIGAVARTDSSPGVLGAVGTVGDNAGFIKSFTEHGYVFCLISVRADIGYQEGLDRHWSRQTRYDFYWPTLAHLGEQAVLNKEIYCDGSANDDDVFGYQERYGEYRYKPSLVTGLFRPDATSNIDEWHLSEDFTSAPTLNQTFICDNSATVVDRAIATPSEPQFIADFYFNYKCARPMPLYGTPGMIDHF